MEREKNYKLVTQKYYLPNLQYNIKDYIKNDKICLASKVVYYKPYSNLQVLPFSTHCWKYLSINLVIELSISTNKKDNS